jgi:hypothetical protein
MANRLLCGFKIQEERPNVTSLETRPGLGCRIAGQHYGWWTSPMAAISSGLKNAWAIE